LELDCREVRVCPLPEAEEESPDDVDIAEERYVGGNCGGGTICAPPMPNTDPPSTEDVVTAAKSPMVDGGPSDGAYPGGGRSSME